MAIASCTKNDKVPAYVEIQAVTVDAAAEQGGNTGKITDVWVEVNEELLGMWELPAQVPVLAEGPNRITVTAGIKRNGMYDDRLRYPFYARWDATVDLARTTTTRVAPVVRYIAAANFWVESFDDTGTRLVSSAGSDTTLLRFTPADHPGIVLDNSPCGGFALDRDHRRVRLQTEENFQVTGGPVFLEFDYSTDILLTMGVLYTVGGTSRAEPYVYITPTQGQGGGVVWNKMYIDLSPLFNQALSRRDFYFEATLADSRERANAYFDNIKLVRANP